MSGVGAGTIKTDIPARLDRDRLLHRSGADVRRGVIEIFLGVKAEGQSLENIAKPLTAEDDDAQAAPANA